MGSLLHSVLVQVVVSNFLDCGDESSSEIILADSSSNELVRFEFLMNSIQKQISSEGFFLYRFSVAI